MSRFILGVSLPFLLATAEQLQQCAASPVEEAVREDEPLEFSLLQRSLSLSQRPEPRQSIASQVIARPVNSSAPLALLSRSRDIIAWPGACILSVAFAVTLIFVVVLWAAMLEASQASKALPTRAAPPAGGPPDKAVEAPLPFFGAVSGGCAVPPICPGLSLLQGAVQFRIPTASLETLRSGQFPVQVMGPSGKPLLHAWLPLCSKAVQGSAQPQLGYLLQLTTSAALARHPHASMGLLRAGVAQRTEIFGPKNQKYGSMSRCHDKWLVHFHHEGSEQLALTLHHAAAALGFCAYSAEGRQVATAFRVQQGRAEQLSISVNVGGDAMLALLCVLAVVLSMLETVAVGDGAPAASPAALPPGYADACGAVPVPPRSLGLPPLPPQATLPRLS